VLRRLAGLVHQGTPAFVGYVAVNELCHLAAALFRRSAAVLLPML
jgi:hypothetical protein